MQNPQQTMLPSPLMGQQASRNSKKNLQELPPIPDKLYFTIGEASKLCFVKPYVLRYWEQEFPELSPDTRRGQRRYYKREDILLIRRIKSLLYQQGFTIEGARLRLSTKEKNAETPNCDAEKLVKNIVTKLSEIVSRLKE
jgi:DNA-binding transcriptional MerR regulator